MTIALTLTSSLTTATRRSVGSRPTAAQKKVTWIAGSRNMNMRLLEKKIDEI